MTITSSPQIPDAAGTNADSRASTALSIEQLNVTILLQALVDRTASIDSKVAALESSPPKSQPLLELARIALGGWPAFGFLFLILFFGPLRAALTAIPAKIQSASEIALAGVTLKTTITQVAASQGVAGIGKTIPQLSGEALQLLLRAPRDGEGLITYSTGSDPGRITSFGLPTDEALAALAELQDAGFLELSGGMDGMKPIDGTGMRKLVEQIKADFPGHPRGTVREWRSDWELDTPVPADHRGLRPDLIWRLTDSGAAAVKVVITAVSSELSRAQELPSSDQEDH